MAFPRKLLNAEEQMVLDLRPHWIYILPSLAALIGAVLLGLLVIFGLEDGALRNVLSFAVGLLVLGCLGWFGSKYSKWLTTTFAVTSERVMSRHGVFAKSGMEIPLGRINTVTFDQNVFERLIGAGDLGIESASQGGQQEFDDIRQPAHVQREIYVQMEANNRRNMSYMGQASVAATQGATGNVSLTIAEQLEKLDELRRNGVLSEEEFQLQKTRLLNG